MAVRLMLGSVPLRGRKGQTSDTCRSSHQREATRELKRPSRLLSTECSTENLLIALVISHTQNKGGKPCLRILTNLLPNSGISLTLSRYRKDMSCFCEHMAKGFKSIPVRI